MNKEIQEKIVSWMEGVENFASTEIPEFVTEVLWWYGITSFIGWVTFVLCFIIGLMIFRHGLKMVKESSEKKENNFWYEFYGSAPTITGFAMFIVSVVMMLIGFVGFFSESDWLQILVAPKLFLLEYATNLLASKG